MPIMEAEKAAVKEQIQRALDAGLEATRRKDIEAYMAGFPEEIAIYDESGEIIDRATQRANVLRDWAIIDTTLYISMDIDSLVLLSRDSATVYTSQRWERIMYRQDGVTTDTVLTTQRHREHWKRLPDGWYGYEIVELGGKVYINGEEWSN